MTHQLADELLLPANRLVCLQTLELEQGAEQDLVQRQFAQLILALLGETLSQRLQTFHGLFLVRLARTKVIQIVISGWAGAHASLRRRREGRAS